MSRGPSAGGPDTGADGLIAGADLVAVVGPTAAGKSAYALCLAEAVGGEIINADAMQSYRGLDIGTAKPNQDDRRRVPHHLFELWDIHEPASVAVYQQRARAVITDILERGRRPILVGGSRVYLRAACDVLQIPPTEPDVRRRIQLQADQVGAAAMHSRLATVDQDAAAAIDPRNLRRIVRALEVIELTGSFRATMPEPVAWRPTVWLGLDRSRAELDHRIERRALAMWRDGLLEETFHLMRRGLWRAPTAGHAVGYEESMAVIRGRIDADAALAATVARTRALARRQQRSFRGDARVRRIPAGEA